MNSCPVVIFLRLHRQSSLKPARSKASIVKPKVDLSKMNDSLSDALRAELDSGAEGRRGGGYAELNQNTSRFPLDSIQFHLYIAATQNTNCNKLVIYSLAIIYWPPINHGDWRRGRQFSHTFLTILLGNCLVTSRWRRHTAQTITHTPPLSDTESAWSRSYC